MATSDFVGINDMSIKNLFFSLTSNPKLKPIVMLLSAAFIFFSLSVYFLKTQQSKKTLELVSNQISERLEFWEKDFYTLLEDKALLKSLVDGNYTETDIKALFDKPYSILLYKKEQLIFWSNNEIIPEEKYWFEQYTDGVNFVKLANAYYQLIIRKHSGNHSELQGVSIIALLPIKYTYNGKNPSLLNSYNPALNIPENIVFSEHQNKDWEVIGKNGLNRSLYINFQKSLINKFINWWAVAFQVLGIVLLLVAIQLIAIILINSYDPLLSYIFFGISVFVVWILVFLLDLPATLENLPVFNTSVVGETFFKGTLGDLGITLLFLAWFLSFFYHYRIKTKTQDQSLHLRLFKFTVALFGTFAAVRMAAYLFHLIILNFDISLDFSYIFKFEQPTLLAMLCVVLFFVSFFYFLQLIGIFLLNLKIPLKFQLLILGIFLFFTGLYLLFFSFESELIPVLIGFLAFMVAYPYIVIELPPIIATDKAVFWLAALTLFASALIYIHTLNHEIEKRKAFARVKAIQKDMVFEAYIDNIATTLTEDIEIQKYYKGQALTKQDEFKTYIISRYLDEFSQKYEVQNVLAFNIEGKPIDRQNNLFLLEAFNKKIGFNSINTNNSYLYLVPNEINGYNYLLKLPIFDTNEIMTLPAPIGYLVIELEPKTGRQESVYPEIFTNDTLSEPKGTEEYNYAIYQNNQLESYRGSYIYRMHQPNKLLRYEGGIDTTFTENNFSHLLYWAPNQSLFSSETESITKIPVKMVIVSKPVNTLYSFLSLASYLFIASIVLLLATIIFKAIFNINNGRTDFQNLFFSSLQKRIYSSILVTNILAFIIVGIVTLSNFYNRSNEKHSEQLTRKLNEALATIENLVEKIKNQKNTEYKFNILESDSLSPIPVMKDSILFDKSEMSEILKDVSKIYDIDINLYDKSGTLITSSLIKIFNNGYVSKLMHPIAWHWLAAKKSNQFIQTEKFGKLNYQSGYIPVKNEEGSENIAFLNLPYYARQKALNRELTGFMTTLINIYFLFFLIGIILAYFIALNITNPLKMISDKLKGVKLGEENEMLDWPHDDAVGELVSQYNQTIQELVKNVRLLAAQERQIAWQEMAQQIAHEIKNCLTPMKLSLQLLQRAINDQKPNIAEHSLRTSKTLVEQIDALSQIATEFSDFAKLPEANIQRFNLNEVALNSIELYKNNNEVEINSNLTGAPYFVFADRSQMLRVFNNLIKNAIQSIPDERKGIITINFLPASNQYLTISIQDNGKGISEELRDKIFLPNFTTRITGMGLGLAMVNKIIEEAGGKIWFHSEPDKGTTFYFQLLMTMPDSENDFDKTES